MFSSFADYLSQRMLQGFKVTGTSRFLYVAFRKQLLRQQTTKMKGVLLSLKKRKKWYIHSCLSMNIIVFTSSASSFNWPQRAVLRVNVLYGGRVRRVK